MGRFNAILSRDFRLAIRQGSESLTVVIFFVLCVIIFPLAIGPEKGLLVRIGPGIIWASILLALCTHRLYAIANLRTSRHSSQTFWTDRTIIFGIQHDLTGCPVC